VRSPKDDVWRLEKAWVDDRRGVVGGALGLWRDKIGHHYIRASGPLYDSFECNDGRRPFDTKRRPDALVTIRHGPVQGPVHCKGFEKTSLLLTVCKEWPLSGAGAPFTVAVAT
jgi:hypothetical protein